MISMSSQYVSGTCLIKLYLFLLGCNLSRTGKSVTLIASATVGSIVFIALIIVLIYLYSIWKKKGGTVVQERQANAAKASFDNQAYACP